MGEYSGNFNEVLRGRDKFEKYPEFKEIRDSLYKCRWLMDFTGEYEVANSYVDILYGDVHTANFTIKLPDGTENMLKGRIVDGIFIIESVK